MLQIVTDSPQGTVKLGKNLARVLKANAIVALTGDLGTGKTTLVKGIAKGLGINPRQVSSPSFTLIKEYKKPNLRLFHCDLYRLEDKVEIAGLGIEDYFNQQGILVIEWAERARELLPGDYLQINIFHVSENKRKFKIFSNGKIYQPVIRSLKKII